ncbi:hypothetical protein [Ornithinibacillus bavariensis]|uniref:hypothetical protein n=1 Tax=Ornithinibacillus bavariensis TaxID=545502 RepID=UPI000ED5E3E0|nr:hypothetical protein [Ornithinibacillus sp.]
MKDWIGKIEQDLQEAEEWKEYSRTPLSNEENEFLRKMQYKLKWVINPYRKDKRTGVISPVKRSEYAKQLFKVGSGWSEQAGHRKHS